MLPQGADCAVMVEYSRPAGGNLVELTRSQAPGDNVILRDDDAAAGDVLLQAGQRLRPQDLGLLAAFGVSGVGVRRRPRVAVLSTGDEVVPSAETPPPGKVRDVNAHSIAALCREAGADALRAGLVRDDAQALQAAVARLAQEYDVVAVSGGSPRACATTRWKFSPPCRRQACWCTGRPSAPASRLFWPDLLWLAAWSLWWACLATPPARSSAPAFFWPPCWPICRAGPCRKRPQRSRPCWFAP
jgi:hypothetical protein